MGFKGSVESFSLADVFQNLSMNQQTGTLRVYTTVGDEKLVFFQGGHVHGLSRGLGKPFLIPEVFLARGYITQSQLDAALARHTETATPAVNCLIEQQALGDEQIEEVTRLQIEEEIFDLFGWEKANFEFNEGPPPEGLLATQPAGKRLAVPISHLIMEAARRVDEWERLRKQVSSFKEIYSLDPAARKAIEKGEMEADPIEKRVAGLIDCTRDVDDLIHDSNLFKFEVVNALAGLIQSSIIRPASLQELLAAEQECQRQVLPKRRIKILERILALGGENPRVRRELADSLAKDQRVDTACIHYSVLADNELQAHRTDGAVDLFCRILGLSSKHVKAHEQLAAIYAKRGQKREAYVHYQALFETFREQNHMREARGAAIAALECDPTQVELRASLIELFLAESLKEPAAQQLELQGDQAARAGNVKMAADSYRRAMQLSPSNKRLKKKLQDVMLTKEDRRARKRRIVTMCVVGAVLVCLTTALFVKEQLNESAFAAAKRAAGVYAVQGDECGRSGKFGEAKEQYEIAARQYSPVTRLWSPLLGLHDKAKSEIVRLSTLARESDEKARKQQDENVKASGGDLEAAENAFKAKRFKEASEFYTKVVQNADSPEQNRQAAERKLREIQKLVDGLEKALRCLKGDPLREFSNGVEDEAGEKRRLIDEYTGFPGFNIADIEMPVLIQPDTDGVQVFLDNRPVGTANAAGGREGNTFRYPAAGAHRFEFKKPGFKTISQNTASLRSPILQLKLEREPAVRMDLRPYMAPDVNLCGEPVCDGGLLYVGMSDGGLLQVRPGEPPTVRAYKLPGGGGLHKEVYGPIYIHKRPGKEDYIVYCTMAGDCIGIKAAGTTFKEAWTPVKGGATPLSAPPSVFKLRLMSNPVFAMPADKRLIMVDCDEGIQAAGSPVDFKATLTSSPAAIEQESLIVAGVKDGQAAKLRGFSLRDRSFRDWSTGFDVGALRGEPAVFEDDIVAGGDDGNFHLFTPSRPGEAPVRITLERAGAIVSEPLIVKKRAFVGTIETEGFWCADLVRHEPQWTQPLRNMGGVRSKPAILDDTIYFGTDKGRVYALDSEKGKIRWTYTVEGGSRFVGSPLVHDRRVYMVNAEGTIFGFDE